MSLMSISDPIRWKKKRKKKRRKENIPRVKALITSLSPTEEKRSGFSLSNVSDNISIVRGLKADIITSHPKTFENTADDDWGQNPLLILQERVKKTAKWRIHHGWLWYFLCKFSSKHFNLHHSNYFLSLWNRRLICSSWRACWALKQLTALHSGGVYGSSKRKWRASCTSLCRIDETPPPPPSSHASSTSAWQL